MKRPWGPDLRGPAFFLAGVAVFATLPLWIDSLPAGLLASKSRLVEVGIYFIAMIGLNIVSGYSGQISIGHGAFMGVGGYTAGVLMFHYGVHEVLTIPIAGALAGIVGFLFGFPALRLHGVYLALATFGAAVAFLGISQSTHWESYLGGLNGIQFGLPQSPYYLTWGIAGGMFVAAWLLMRGRLGRSLRAVRDAPLAAVSSGLNLATYKTTAFGLAAVYAGVAGALLAILVGSVSPLSFPVLLSIQLLVGTALGGFGALSGLIFGALFIVFAPLHAEEISETAPAVMYGLILIAVLFLIPGGVAHLLKRITNALYSRPTQAEAASKTRSRS